MTIAGPEEAKRKVLGKAALMGLRGNQSAAGIGGPYGGARRALLDP